MASGDNHGARLAGGLRHRRWSGITGSVAVYRTGAGGFSAHDKSDRSRALVALAVLGESRSEPPGTARARNSSGPSVSLTTGVRRGASSRNR